MTGAAPRLRIVFAAAPDAGVVDEVSSRAPAEVVELPAQDDEGLLAAAMSADILVTRSSQLVTAALLERSAGRLRAVVQASAGTDNIDERAAARLGIAVVAVEPGNAVSVAELTMLSVAALLRDVRRHWRETSAGRWPDRERLDDRELSGRTIGLVGLGRVGTRVAVRAVAFGMTVLAYDPYVEPRVFERVGAVRCEDLDAMLAELDVLSLHCPLTGETDGMIDAARLGLLRPEAFLVNTARGRIVDERALAQALDAERLAGAALDVFSAEPAPVGGLASHPRVLATPHLAGHTRESHARRRANVIESLIELARRLDGGRTERGE